jgi:tetratricopeptide (TPR) repeat protein
MSTRLYLTLAAALALAGCDQVNKDSAAAQTDDSNNPNYKQAQQDLDNNNPTGAIADYEAALGANPKLAGAHYELGVIYGDKMNDPVSSIYHFKRFIDLSPNSDKKDQVQALIDKESTVFAASLPNSSAPSADDMEKLQNENATLKKQVSDATTTITKLQAQLSRHHLTAVASAEPAPSGPMLAQATPSDPSPVVSTDTGGSTSNGAAATPPKALPVDQATAAAGNADTQGGDTNSAPVSLADARSYKVVKGDSYWKIAKKMYPGDTKNGVQKIQDANKETMGKPLKIGQVLVIPK